MQHKQPNHNRPQIISLPHRDTVTSAQVNTLLSMFNMLASSLRTPEVETMFGTQVQNRPELDGGAKAAVETALMAVCDRMESLAKDVNRWDVSQHDAVEENAKKIQESHLKAMEAQRAVAEEMNTPHFRHKPSLLKLSDGTWAAILGDVKDLDNSITGVGFSPEDALRNFDAIFKGETTESLQKWAEQHPPDNNEPQIENSQYFGNTQPPQPRANKRPNRRPPGPDEPGSASSVSK